MPPRHSLRSLMTPLCNSMGTARDRARNCIALAYATGYTPGNAGHLQELDVRRLDQQAQLGKMQANGQRFVDVLKLLLAASGRVDIQEHEI